MSLPSWERGLKLTAQGCAYMNYLSLPSWERGLKWRELQCTGVMEKSLPSWERGLKYDISGIAKYHSAVAPLVGAWIEITVAAYWNYSPYRRSPRGSVD